MNSMSKQTQSDEGAQTKILFITNSDEHFFNHLLPIAIGAVKNNYKVVLCAPFDKHEQLIAKHKIKTINYYLIRDGINPLTEIRSFIAISKAIYTEKPDIIHNFTIKPIFYGTIASTFSTKKTLIINNFLGLGYAFTQNSPTYNLIRFCLLKAINLVSKIRKIKVIVQNSDDKNLLSKYLFSTVELYEQCSVGVDTKELMPLPEPKGKIVFALVARMLRDKGVVEFIQAANLCHKHGIEADFWLVGEPDPNNRATLTIDEIEELITDNSVKYCGFQDVKKVWIRAHVAVLPSYREGMSRSLLEAGAYGRSIIAANAPGANDLIAHNKNGLLVKMKDCIDLYEAICYLVKNPEKRHFLATNIRKTVESNFDSKYIVEKMIRFYSGSICPDKK
jgi:glycosyltransferase involved in cell wall biosynthesis